MNNKIKTRFFRYSGTKHDYTEIVNPLINKSDKNIYVEPFIGSGAILFNLEKDFDLYVVNDIDRNITNIYKTFKEIDYKKFKEIFDTAIKKFTTVDIGFKVPEKQRTTEIGAQAKENYYNFRNWFNENYWGTDTIEEGVYCMMLANMTINSMLRFGPNGMNQSWGNRFYILDERNFNSVKKTLQKTEIYNGDYKILFEKYPDALFFLDPPYFSQDSSYTAFSEDQFKEFLDIIKDKEYIYTDILNDFNEKINSRKLVREMNSTSPSTKKQKNGNLEFIFSPLLNIELKNTEIDEDNTNDVNEIDEDEW